ncbi:hypothetical protein PAPYR_1590 [Paratrimastix pyriformis]|uniref:Uncharacterized protein n=1 Tax=Paratrimastix pyriformis TaxID=342808 RepID=A0ABQ8UYQ8_9EUKA|nr:hypothetical protein PAPYR_1590 [Paratrimastix pyriformis]
MAAAEIYLVVNDVIKARLAEVGMTKYKVGQEISYHVIRDLHEQHFKPTDANGTEWLRDISTSTRLLVRHLAEDRELTAKEKAEELLAEREYNKSLERMKMPLLHNDTSSHKDTKFSPMIKEYGVGLNVLVSMISCGVAAGWLCKQFNGSHLQICLWAIVAAIGIGLVEGGLMLISWDRKRREIRKLERAKQRAAVIAREGPPSSPQVGPVPKALPEAEPESKKDR